MLFSLFLNSGIARERKSEMTSMFFEDNSHKDCHFRQRYTQILENAWCVTTARPPSATGARRQDGAQVLFRASDVPLRTRVLVPSCGKLNSRPFSEESTTDFPRDERNARVI